MSWFKIPDELADGDEWEIAGLMGRGLYIGVGLACAKDNTDGIVTAVRLRRIAKRDDVKRPEAFAATLVEIGWWHTPESMCGECSANATALPADGEFYVHLWWKHQVSKAARNDPVVKQRELRRKRLYENHRLVGEIRSRDRDLCRYCGMLTKWPPPGTRGGDHRSKTSGTLDHLDPWGENTSANLVVACRTCNGRKKDRTPEQWVAAGGLPLLPPPGKRRDQSRRFENQTRDQTGGVENQPPDQIAPSRDARDGPGLVGNEPGLVGSSRDGPPGAVPALAGAGEVVSGARMVEGPEVGT